MTFILRMAVRETRASWKRLLFFFVCIAIGVGAIVALRSVIQSVRHVLAREARTLLAADVAISTNRPWDPQARAAIDRRLASAPVTARTETIETATMVRPTDESKTVVRMVELRAVEPAFPFYGRLVLGDGGRAYSHDLLRGRGALVRPELLAQLGLGVGDAIYIGSQPFTIRGVIATEPGRRIGGFSFGPRVMIDLADLRATGLLTFGSRARYQILLRVPDAGLEPLVRQLRQDFKDQFVTARSYRATEDQIGEDLLKAENYLSLVGLVIVVLGGIGVSSVTRVFVQQKIRSIAVMKCVGGTTRQILAVYLLQVLALGLAGSLMGVGLAAIAISAIPRAAGANGLLGIPYGLTGPAVVQGLGIGVLVSLLFSLLPLLEVRHVRPSLLLRQEIPPRARLDWLRFGAAATLVTALVALAAWQAASLRVGLVVCAGFAALTIVLHLAGLALIRAVSPLRYARWFALRQAVLHLSRPGNQTRVLLLAVGLGSFFIIGVRALQASLLQEFALEVAAEAPDMFLIDIQPDQVDGVRALVASRLDRNAPSPRIMPVLRARITGVRGREVNLETFEDVRGRGSLGREYVLTYRSHLESNERLLRGRWWSGSEGAEPEVSIEESIHDRFQIDLGDLIRFDVLGRLIQARVTSIRSVDWNQSRNGGFMFVFRPGTFDRAPHTFVAPIKAPGDPGARARFQHELVARFPNVSAIDLREVLDAVRAVVDNVTLAITIVGSLVLLSGGLILVGAVAMTKFRRIYEAAIFKTLGASTRLIASMLLLEYGVLGALAGAVGSLGAVALTWAVSKYALEIPWRLTPALNIGGVIVTAALVGSVGVISSLDVLGRKPLATLRAE